MPRPSASSLRRRIFIDDSQKNVDGAKQAGWQAVLFKNAKTLEADLERFGITP